ncbi:MAG: hypothetical protein Faunusvirus3_1 [Faunusvirus sp.]|jgi:hypothetical protein|uniref:Uncharacterized protein n=1 Tax=Faunusvirus sp. TaxID=2487766 RepID=A0A3G4ZYQ0_9VIRU|nr:MAG: hypothetical protein Faunusvirus3_1 [Faunusvirus sp.]
MIDRIYLDSKFFIISLSILLVISFFFIYIHVYNFTPVQSKKIIINNRPRQRMVDPLIARDMRALTNPLSEPTKRVDRSQFPSMPIAQLLEQPTRGYPDNFVWLGNLSRQSDEKIVKLFGRQTYPGSNVYEYYGYSSDSYGMETKIRIDVRQRQLYDGDMIDIPLFDSTKGQFRLTMNNDSTFHYNPFVL